MGVALRSSAWWGAVAFFLASGACSPGGGGGGDDGDAAEDTAEDTAVDDTPSDLEEAVDDVPAEASDVEGDDGASSCSEPGLHVGAEVLVADPGAQIRGARIACGGGVVGVGWNDTRLFDVAVNEEVYFRVLETDGAPVGSEVRLSNASLESRIPAVAWAGDRFVALWGDVRTYPAGDVYIGAVDPAGGALGAEVRITTGGQGTTHVAATWTGERLGAAWTDDRDAAMDVYFALSSVDGVQEGDIVRISDAPGNSFNPSVAWSGDRFYVVWADPAGREAWEFRIHLSILDPSGAVVSGPTLVSAEEHDAKTPVAAWSGDVLGVCWEDYREGAHEIYCATYDADGVPVTPATRISSLGGNSMSTVLSPSLVATPRGFALAWADEDGTAGDTEVYFVELSTSLEPGCGDAPLTDTDGWMRSVGLAWTGGHDYGVAYVLVDGGAEDEDTLSYLPFTWCE